MSEVHIIRGDARQMPLADECVQCVVTSPPYWGLRKYAGEQEVDWDEWRGAFGLEPTIGMYVQHTVEILREVRRVLRPDGVVFWNIGDSYASTGGHTDTACNERRGAYNLGNRPEHDHRDFRVHQDGRLKPKDLCLIPERVALAAQADGWWVRSLIIWAKPNPMPESCKDRPTDAYEHIIMLTKSARYYWDADAVREPSITGDARKPYAPGQVDARGNGHDRGGGAVTDRDPSSRNLRNVWTFPTQPYRGAHFATFPEEIQRRCILAATSERGACARCGAPWQRITEKETHFESGSGKAGTSREEIGGKWEVGGKNGNANIKLGPVNDVKTVGWQPGCRCRGQRGRTMPSLVLDPFAGSGTVGRVAVELNRRAVLIDLAYHDHAEKRTRNVQRQLIGAAR